MSRYYDVKSEADLYESSDEEESKKIANKFGLKSCDVGRVMCEDLITQYNRIHELQNQPRTPPTQIPDLDPSIRERKLAFKTFLHENGRFKPVVTGYLHSLHGIQICKPSHITEQTPNIPSENYIRKAQEDHVGNVSRKENENREKAGCSSQTVNRTNVSDEHTLIYKLDKFSENHMIIFNHENFLEDTRREGSALDVKSLRKTFESLRFSVTVHNDLEEAELFTTLKEFSNRDFRRCGCVCVAILTHGSDHGFLEAFDSWYSERAVFACFNTVTNSTLTDKPIIFLIQACRGRNLSRRVPVPEPVPEPDETPNIQLDSSNVKNAGLSLPAESNLIIFHSAFFGKASARDRHKGSWFIQTVCEQIDLHAASEDLERIFLRVRNIVAREKEAGGGKQMPITSSALTKHLFLK